MRLNLEQLAVTVSYMVDAEFSRAKLIESIVDVLKEVDEAGFQDGYEQAQEDVETGVLSMPPSADRVMTSKSAKRIEVVDLLALCKQTGEKPGDTILRGLRHLKQISDDGLSTANAYQNGYRDGFSDCEAGCVASGKLLDGLGE
jgi:hypothetical protein